MSAIIPIVQSAIGVSATALYTWSSGTAEVESVDICNILTTPVKVSLYYDNNGTTVYIMKAVPLTAGATVSYRGALPMTSTGQAIKVVSDTAASLDVVGRATTF